MVCNIAFIIVDKMLSFTAYYENVGCLPSAHESSGSLYTQLNFFSAFLFAFVKVHTHWRLPVLALCVGLSRASSAQRKVRCLCVCV